VSHFWATVCKTVHPMLSVRCLSVCPVLSVLSVTFVHCGQTVGRVKTKLGMQVGIGPGHIVLGGDPAPPPLKGHSPPIFGPYLLRPNGCMNQDVTWYGGRPRPWRLCVRWGPRPPPQKGAEPPNFRPLFIIIIIKCIYKAHFRGCHKCDQTAGRMKLVLGAEVGLSPGDFVLDGDPAPPQKVGGAPPNFRPMFIAAKLLNE